jgi:hypothetical protein
MQSLSIETLLALLAFHTLLVGASPFLNGLAPHIRQDGLQARAKSKVTGTGTVKLSTGAVGATATSTAAKTTATSALNATVLDCQIIVRASSQHD